jgi:hypothetical protein
MSAYALGNLVGRFVLSYALIWFVMWLMLAKLNWRDAFRRTHHWSGLIATTTLFLIGLISTAEAGDRAGRPMVIHRVPALGLEIWTEQDPQWETQLTETKGAATFIAETPALTYPPAYMSWTSLPQIKFDAADIEAAARGTIHQVAANYGVRGPVQLPIERKQYGDLSGYESIFAASSQQVPVEVRVFCGHSPGRPAVVMQVATLKDKLGHLSEQTRRSWSNVRYLQ